MDRLNVEFSREELWLLHDHVRHEMGPAEDHWRLPPVSKDLNDQVAFALAVEQDTAMLDLDEPCCLVIDYWIRRGMTNRFGVQLGESILTKVFKTRQSLAMGFKTSRDGDRAYFEALAAAGDDKPEESSGLGLI
ncbi:MAG: hypothetical protein GEU28_01340 [Dehalococcoidia bacterium]|nr:hypothetical protein [Dehalococcoidia bacterium]